MSVRVRGPLACFTRPELKVERVSYPVMTPSAARGVLEAVMWKPAIRWHVERIHVLSEIRFTTFRRNEVGSKAPQPGRDVVTKGGAIPSYFADEDRAQRNSVALVDADYRIDAHFTITDRVGPEDNVVKFVEMFQRRVAKGQCFHHPYLGCREFAADVMPDEGALPAIDDSRDLGLMLWDIDFQADGNVPRFFRARLEHGVLHVPEAPLTLDVLAGRGGTP